VSHESHLGQRLSAFIDGELSHHQRERVLAHLAHCVPCRQEAAALRTLKQRMHALGEATADTALTDRLIAVAGVAGSSPWGRRPRLAGRRPTLSTSRRHWPVRSIAVAGLTLAGLGVPAAAFLAGGGQQEPGPSVTPAIDTYMMQHDLSAGNAPAVGPSPSRLPSAPAPTPSAVAPTRSAVAPTESAASSAFGALSAAGAAVASARAAAALTRVAAASTRVAAAATGVSGGTGRARRLATPAEAR
jgi:Putative zinc-finger